MIMNARRTRARKRASVRVRNPASPRRTSAKKPSPPTKLNPSAGPDYTAVSASRSLPISIRLSARANDAHIGSLSAPRIFYLLFFFPFNSFASPTVGWITAEKGPFTRSLDNQLPGVTRERRSTSVQVPYLKFLARAN